MAINLKDIPKLVQAAVDTIGKKRTLTTVAKKLVPRIQTRVRVGKGVQENLGNPHSLPVLKDKTKRNRTSLKKQGKLTGPGAKPAKSALNRTGALVGDIGFETKTNELEIKFKSQAQLDKMEDLIALDRKYTIMNISKAEFKFALKELSAIIERALRRLI